MNPREERVSRRGPRERRTTRRPPAKRRKEALSWSASYELPVLRSGSEMQHECQPMGDGGYPRCNDSRGPTTLWHAPGTHKDYGFMPRSPGIPFPLSGPNSSSMSCWYTGSAVLTAGHWAPRSGDEQASD